MSKYKLDKSAQVVENQNYIMTQEEVCETLNYLETKLAEKEKEILLWKRRNTYIEDELDVASRRIFALENSDDEYKISFCIEQLEKAKKEFNARKLEYITTETKTHIYGLRIDRINELIDNQIKELKEKAEDE